MIGRVFLQKVNSNRSMFYRCRFYNKERSILKNIYDNVVKEWKKDEKLKKNLEKFREETRKMEKSDEFQKMRQYYKKIESEISQNASEKLRGAVKATSSIMLENMDEIIKNESVKKSFEAVGRTASKMGMQVSKTAQQLGQSSVYQYAKQGVKAVEEELISDENSVYRAPDVLKTRKEAAGDIKERVIEADEKTTGLDLHADSKWTKAWTDFKDNNPYMQRFFDLKTQYAESDNAVTRTAKFMTGRITSLFGGFIGSGSETSQVLEELHRIDPNFSLEAFIKFCRRDVIPNILEAIVQGNEAILQDWCHEAPFNILTEPLKQLNELGAHYQSKVLDISRVEFSAAKMMEQGPVLIIQFTAQQIQAVCNAQQEIIQGNPEKIVRVSHIWALCRDRNDLDPWTAWRLLDAAMVPGEQWL